LELNICEELIASTARIKIIKVLQEQPDIRIMALKRKVGCRYNELDRNLQKLKEAGVITDESRLDLIKQPNARIIHFKPNQPTSKVLVRAVKTLSETTKSNDCMPGKGPLFPKVPLTEKQMT
jgi:predicted transcriptional regulator